MNCGKCHTCGTPLRSVLDGEEWCPKCRAYRRYRTHGWGGLDADDGQCGGIHVAVSTGDIIAAKMAGDRVGYDRQSRYIEIILASPVRAIWEALHPRLIPKRILGLPYMYRSAEDNRRVGQAALWHLFGGYVLDGWNSVRADCYSHSAAMCWDGLRRHANALWVEYLSAVPHVAERDKVVAAINKIIAPHSITITDLDAPPLPFPRFVRPPLTDVTHALYAALEALDVARKEGNKTAIAVAEHRLRAVMHRASFAVGVGNNVTP